MCELQGICITHGSGLEGQEMLGGTWPVAPGAAPGLITAIGSGSIDATSFSIARRSVKIGRQAKQVGGSEPFHE